MSEPSPSNPAASRLGFIAGLKAGLVSMFALVLAGSYVSIGALAHDVGFPILWVMLSSLLVWAAPAQVILISSLGAGAAPFEVAVAIGLSGLRLLPMVVALIPVLKGPATRTRDLILPAHFTAISMWIEVLRLAPNVPRERRIGFANGIGVCFCTVAILSSVVGYYLAGELPVLLVAALLFLTPMSFLVSVIRNSRTIAEHAAFWIGLVMAPLLAWYAIGLDLLWTGLAGGTAAYALQRAWKARA